MSPPLNFTEAILDPVVSNFSSLSSLPCHSLKHETHSDILISAATVSRLDPGYKKRKILSEDAENRNLHCFYVVSDRAISFEVSIMELMSR